MTSRRKKISAHLPSSLLKEACELGSLNQTDTLILGLKALIAQFKREKLVQAAGKFHFKYSVDETRERRRL